MGSCPKYNKPSFLVVKILPRIRFKILKEDPSWKKILCGHMALTNGSMGCNLLCNDAGDVLVVALCGWRMGVGVSLI